MAWSVKFSKNVDRDFSKLDKSIQKRIFSYLYDRIALASNPRAFGHGLQHELADLWR